MSKKTIYEYDGYLFNDHDELEEYIANLTGGEYNNADPYDTPAFYEAMEQARKTPKEMWLTQEEEWWNG